jgi:hypothetical protein
MMKLQLFSIAVLLFFASGTAARKDKGCVQTMAVSMETSVKILDALKDKSIRAKYLDQSWESGICLEKQVNRGFVTHSDYPNSTDMVSFDFFQEKTKGSAMDIFDQLKQALKSGKQEGWKVDETSVGDEKKYMLTEEGFLENRIITLTHDLGYKDVPYVILSFKCAANG